MIEVYDDFIPSEYSNELIDYYENNKDMQLMHINKVYSFSAIDIRTYYENFKVSNLLKLEKATSIRIQLLDNSLKTNDNFHTHTIQWTYLIFLNDIFKGGELIINNFTIKPKRNQLLVFPGYLKHKVNPVLKGKRYTLVSFTDHKYEFKKKVL